MARRPVSIDLDAAYSEPGATPQPWEDVQRLLADARSYWIATVRPDGGPHATPVVGVMVDGAMHITTGPGERKAANLRNEPRCVLTTGRPVLAGTDVVVEAVATRIVAPDALASVAGAFTDKYDDPFRFEVGPDATLTGGGRGAVVYRLDHQTVFAFGKAPFRQTRYRWT